MTDTTTPETVTPEEITETSSPAELRAYAQRERDRRIAMETKVAAVAFKEAGFPEGTRERKALEKFYQGDRTDSAAIKAFADEYGIQASAARGEQPHADPAATVPADARVDRLDAAATPITSAAMTVDQLESEAKNLLVESIKPGADNQLAIEASIAALLTAGTASQT